MEMIIWRIIICHVIFIVCAYADRSTFCARMPTSPLCTSNGDAPAPQSAPAPSPAPAPAPSPVPPPIPAPAPSPSTPGGNGPPFDKDNYCKQYQPNYKYYCTGPGTGDNRLGNFCPSFASICNIPADQQTSRSALAAAPGADPNAAAQQPPNYGTPELCYKYQYLAQSSCTNPATENANSRYYCNYYRQFCTASQTAPGVVPLQVPASDPRCGPYQKQFEVACVRQPITVASAQFCQSYITYCANYQAPPVAAAPVQPSQVPAAPPPVPQTQTQPQAPLPQPQQVPQQVPSNMSPEQVQQMCTQYKTLALQNCKGNEIGQIKQYCDLYRQNCINNGRRR